MLARASKVMHDSVRRYDSVARYGGEEFLIVLPGCDRSNAVGHAERMRAAVARIDVETPKGNIRPTMSFGVAVADDHAMPDAFALIQAADIALYRAKQGGRNRVELAMATEPAAV